MSGKRAFLDLLKQEGVEIMFGNPGTTELPLMDAFAVENDIRSPARFARDLSPQAGRGEPYLPHPQA